MRRILLLAIFVLLASCSKAQFQIPPDVKVARLWGTGFTTATPSLYEVRSSKEFYFVLDGSNTDIIFKSLPHTYDLSYAGAYLNNQFVSPLIQRRARGREYSDLAYSQKPQVFSGNTFAESVSVSGGFYIHFFNFDQNTSSRFPVNDYFHRGLVSLGYQMQRASEGDFYLLCAPVDGYSEDTSRYYNENGLDNDSLFLLKTNYGRGTFDTVAIYRHPANVDEWFNSYFGAFRFNPDDSSLIFVRSDSLFIYDGQNAWPSKIIPKPDWIRIEDINDLDKENYFVTEVISASEFQPPLKVRIKHWSFNGSAFEEDSFLLDLPHEDFWPEGEGFYSGSSNYSMNRLNTDKMEFTLEFRGYNSQSLYQSLLCRFDTAGNLLWSRRMFGEHFPAIITTYHDLGDSILLGGSFCPSPNNYNRVYFTKPFFRVLDTEGNLINKAGDQVLVYPNPFRLDVSVEAKNVEEISLFDLSGREVYSREVALYLDSHRIYYPDLKEGVYFMRIRFSNGQIAQQRILKIAN